MSEIFAVSIISECGFSINEYRMHCVFDRNCLGEEISNEVPQAVESGITTQLPPPEILPNSVTFIRRLPSAFPH